MSTFQTRAEQLAKEIADGIAAGGITVPLPGRRQWAVELGTSRDTLDGAIDILKRKGLVGVKPRIGTFLKKVRKPLLRGNAAVHPVVRVIYSTRNFRNYGYWDYAGWLDIVQQLHQEGIDIRFEKGTASRILEISQGRSARPTLCFLLSFTKSQLAIFENSPVRAVAVTDPLPGVSLPFLYYDTMAAVCHATRLLLARGYDSMKLLIHREDSTQLVLISERFASECRSWIGPPVTCETLRMSLDLQNATAEVQRLARSLKQRTGIVLFFPVSASLVTTALLRQGVRIPDQAQIAVVLGPGEIQNLCPPPIHYPLPREAHVRAVIRIATNFFRTGTLPSRSMLLPQKRVELIE